MATADPIARRDQVLQLRYGMPRGSFDALLRSQQGACAICGGPPARFRLYVDHDDGTGDVRGLLCSSCNIGIGHLGHDPTRLRAAAEYLERPPPDLDALIGRAELPWPPLPPTARPS